MTNEIFDAYTNSVKVNVNPTEAILTFYNLNSRLKYTYRTKQFKEMPFKK